MRRIYIHQLKGWPNFTWNTEALLTRLGEVRHRQGRILGLMSSVGFKLQETAVDIQDLIEKGILEKEPGGGRNTTYNLITLKQNE